MQRWLFTITMLLMAGSAAATVDLPAPTHHHAQSGWRRTTRGWEHSSAWTAPKPATISRLSPVVVGALQVLISLGALVAFEGEAEEPTEGE
jgi:hypothetical protein